MHGLELLKKGIIWRIGDGKKVRIWRDNWIPRGDMKASSNLTNSRVRRVADLINQENHTWKEDMVQEIFLEHVAKEILNIRLPSFEVEDSVAWSLEKNGVFSVRSAYRLTLDLRNIPPPTTSTSLNGDRSLWNLIWKADAPPKVKIFTWKLATNSLTVQTNRCRRL
jgi:hypothetical protein